MELTDKDKKAIKELIEKITIFNKLEATRGVVFIGEPAEEMKEVCRDLNVSWYYVIPDIVNWTGPKLDPNCLYILPANITNKKVPYYD